MYQTRDGAVTAVEPASDSVHTAGMTGEVLDLQGHMLFTAPAEAHAHLDQALRPDHNYWRNQQKNPGRWPGRSVTDHAPAV